MIDNTEKRDLYEDERFYVLMEWAQQRFGHQLWNDKHGRTVGLRWLRTNGYSYDVAAAFGLGYARGHCDNLARAALKAGFKESLLIDAGLCVRMADGTLADRYRHCITFPLRTTGGRVTAFIGRTIDEDWKLGACVDAKESSIHQWGVELFGLHEAMHAIASARRCLVVKGCDDIALMYRLGIENVVATLGMPITQGQARLMERMTREVTLAYGGDAAATKATMRDIDTLLAEGTIVRVLFLPDRDGNLDGFCHKHSRREAKDYIDTHQADFIDFKAGVLLDGQEDSVKRSEGMNDILRSVSLIRDQEVRNACIRKCERLFGLPEDTLTATVGRLIRADIEATDKERARETDMEAIEYMLMEDIVRHGEATLFKEMKDGNFRNVSLAEYVNRCLSEYGMGLENPTHARMLREVLQHMGDEGFTAEEYLWNHPDREISILALRYSGEPYHVARSLRVDDDAEALAKDVKRTLLALRKEHLQQRVERLVRGLDKALVRNDDEETGRLRKELEDINELRRRLSAETGHIAWEGKA